MVSASKVNARLLLACQYIPREKPELKKTFQAELLESQRKDIIHDGSVDLLLTFFVANLFVSHVLLLLNVYFYKAVCFTYLYINKRH